MKKICFLCLFLLPFWAMAQDPLQEQEKGEIESIFDLVQEGAKPKEGYEVFMANFQKRLNVPEMAQKEQISGNVYVQFVVDEAGNLTEIKTVKGIGAGWDEEVVRVFKEYDKKWEAGKQRGVAVKQRMVMKIECKIKS